MGPGKVMTREEASRILEEMGRLLELEGENPFKVRAYLNAARTIATLEEPLETAVRTGTLRRLPGIGPALAEKIQEMVATGRLQAHETLKARVPPGLLELLALPGLGPRKVRVLHQRLGIASLGELEYACRENRLLNLKGFGAKTQARVLEGIRFLKRHQGHFHLHLAAAEAQALATSLEEHPAVERVQVAGGLRRRRELVRGITLVVSLKEQEPVAAFLQGHPQVDGGVESTASGVRFRLRSGIPVDLHWTDGRRFGLALLYATGSQEHVAALEALAGQRGLRLEAENLLQGSRRVPAEEEEDAYRALGLPPIPPELREGQGEVEAAASGTLPRLVAAEDLRGVLHVHTTDSDGLGSLEEMALAAKALGYTYLGISDHSRSAFYARGLEVERVRAQHAAIDALNRRLEGITLLKGIEADILPDGSLDYPDEVLASFDFVIASVHSRFAMTRQEMTARLVRALSNPHVSILGHPTGRLLLARDSYPLDLEAVLQAAARHGVALEINASPYRLDLDWRWCRKARDLGIPLSINPDAHSPEGLSDTVYGVGVARKGWLRREDILNALPLEALRERWRRRRPGVPGRP